MLEGELGLAGFDIPQLDGVVTRGTGKDVLGSRVEQYMANFPDRVLAGGYFDSGGHIPHMPTQPSYGRDVGRLLAIALQSEVLRDLPDEDLRIVSLQVGAVKGVAGRTLPSSEADEISRSLNGLLQIYERLLPTLPCRCAYQSVSRTAAVCPRKRGISSGARPFSLMGMTAKAPPPLASQLTEMYSGLACEGMSGHVGWSRARLP